MLPLSSAASRFCFFVDFGPRNTFEAALPACLLVGMIITTFLWTGTAACHHSIPV